MPGLHCHGGRGRPRLASDPLRPIGSPAMPLRTACPIAPSAAERTRLKAMAYGHKTEHRLRVRAQVVPHAARGCSDACVAQEMGLHLDTVRRWRGRFAEQRTGIARAPRPSTPRPPAGVHAAAGCRGQGAGLPAARRARSAAVALVMPGTGL
ncbi:helix-turn-helix domain-containing protein [Streptomyces sp900116325]|uniref:helix-turn-helix domain-containing protein n=1 Tax=Streptomyces sp. 900116325 TaxID=3154295 RepID=UPI0033CFC9CC